MLAWRESLEAEGIEIAIWSIHRKIGMSGGLFARALLRETAPCDCRPAIEMRSPVTPQAFARFPARSRSSNG